MNKNITGCYFEVIQKLSEMMFYTKDPDVTFQEIIVSIQAVHIEMLKRAHIAMQSAIPESERKSFSRYLMDLAEAIQSEEASPSREGS